MNSTQVESEALIDSTRACTVDMKLEVVVIPVSDVDRAKRFYGDLGWRLDADFAKGDDFRGVQFTPPGSPCSIHFGKGVTHGCAGLGAGPVSRRVRHRGSARRAARSRRRGERGVPRRPGRSRPQSGPASDAAQLRLVRHVQRSGRQPLVAAGGHRAIARTRGREAHDIHARRPSLPPRCGARRPRTASTRSSSASTTRTAGRTGTRSTSSPSRPAKSCRSDQAERQRQVPRRRRRGRHAAALDAARRARHDRHQVRLRRGPVRRVHDSHRRAAGALLPHAGFGRRRKAHHHDRSHRRHAGGQEGPGGLARAGRAAVRLLPVRPDHVGGGAARRQCASRAMRTSTAPWPATSAAAAPIRASAPRSRRPPRGVA